MGAAAVLTVLKDGEQVKNLPVEGDVLVGRDEGCVIRLEDRAVSRKHALFRPTKDGVQVEKKNEFAPLLVNGAECTSAILKEGDVIAIGPYLVKVSVPKGAFTSAPTPAEASLAPTVPEQPLGPMELAEDAVNPALAAGAAAPETAVAPAEPHPPAGGTQAQAGALPATPPQELELHPIDDKPMPEGAPPESANLSASISLQSPPDVPETTGSYDADGNTKVIASQQLEIKLVFPPGCANVGELTLDKPEISIGRGKNCDVILNDKKASRKHAIIRRIGVAPVIRDLESANGVFVNNIRVDEIELSSDDVVRIGDIEFKIVVNNLNYAKREPDFMRIPSAENSNVMESSETGEVINLGEIIPQMEAAEAAAQGANAAQPAPMRAQVAPPPGQQQEQLVPQGTERQATPVPQGNQNPLYPNAVGMNDIPGLSTAGVGRKMSLLERFRAMPKRKRMIYVICLGAIIYLFLDEDNAPVTAKRPKAPATPGVVVKQPQLQATFESLTPDQKHFVETQHALAFEHYRNKEYDKALFELQKIFQLVPEYSNAKEIERYALEGKRMLEAEAKRKQKEEEERKLKALIAQLVQQTGELMKKKDYAKAKELFSEIMSRDPENQEVSRWRKEIEDYEEKLRAAEQEKAVQREVVRHAWEILREGMALKKQGRCLSAITVFNKVISLEAVDKAPERKARTLTRACLAGIKARRDPVLAEAKQAEEQGELSKAFGLYQRAAEIDPGHPVGHEGMARIRGVLHERGKALYTEAVLAESYSDFEKARSKFDEILKTIPDDDVYYERAERKLRRYIAGQKEGGQP